jgi:hypothetical protein
MKKNFNLILSALFVTCMISCDNGPDQNFKDTIVITMESGAKDTIIHDYKATEKAEYQIHDGELRFGGCGCHTLASKITYFKVISSEVVSQTYQETNSPQDK